MPADLTRRAEVAVKALCDADRIKATLRLTIDTDDPLSVMELFLVLCVVTGAPWGFRFDRRPPTRRCFLANHEGFYLTEARTWQAALAEAVVQALEEVPDAQ